MGLTGGLVRRVFTKNPRSEKSRWSSVRVYLCGDEFNSLVAEDDLNSIKSSDAATVTKPSSEVSSSTLIHEQSCNSTIIKPENEENSRTSAAILIQSAFRGFLARKQYQKIRKSDEREVDHVELLQEPSVESEAISTEVQIGGSVDSLRIRDENAGNQHRILSKSQSQVHRLKEEWDDSTVSSNISRMRTQNRLEAMTRRDRALAYAFSQQLRTCSVAKKKSARTDDNETNMGWSWLERWMATRLPDNSTNEGIDRRTTIVKKRLEMALEEKESCGSNDVSVNLDSSKTVSENASDGFGPIKNKMKAARSASRMKSSSVAVYHCGSTISNKVNKRVSLRDALKEKRCKQVQENSKLKNPEKQM
ncbi:putative IQ motif, EF-hand binding protein [Dioscorea sansibarensis]